MNWANRLDYWTGLMDWTNRLDYWTGLMIRLLDWTND